MYTKDEIENKLYYVDCSYGWHFAKGKEVLVKAKRLVKNNYTLVDCSEDKFDQVGLERIERYVNKSAGVPFGIISYKDITEYVDRKEKVYYFAFNGQTNSNLGV